MEQNNKLIAEFMGVYSKENGYDYTKIGNIGTMYHISWDWLIPVVQKIGDEYLNTPFNELNNKVNTWTLEDTYNAVVEFIKNQNN